LCSDFAGAILSTVKKHFEQEKTTRKSYQTGEFVRIKPCIFSDVDQDPMVQNAKLKGINRFEEPKTKGYSEALHK
jgi:hypothetical protein